MPIYEYECRKCGGTTEKIQGIGDPPLRKCPSCGGRLDKVMSPGAFILKGTGWYATDYANKGNGNGTGRPAKKEDRKEAASCPAAGSDATPACAGCPKKD